MSDILLLTIGIAMLSIGGEALIRGSLASASYLKISPLLSGLVIVGFGTSMPELMVSINAALNEQPDIAVGNVVGSNIGNVLLILGVCALITPMSVKPLVLKRDAVTVVAASCLFMILAFGGSLQPIDGLIFLSALVAYLIWTYRSERFHAAPAGELHNLEAKEVSNVPKSKLVTVVLLVAGLALLIYGSQVLLQGATGLARSFGIPDAVLGLTIVAVGTSLPEFSISVIAALRRHADVAVGNILGSNIFNLLGILGISALIQPLPIPARIMQFDQWVMLGVSLLLILFLYTGNRIGRLEGGILLAGYVVYIGIGVMGQGALIT